MRSARTGRILLLVGALAAFVLLAACDPPPPPPPSSPAAADIVERHNYLRSLNRAGPLVADAGMQANAQLHADRLVAGAASCAAPLWHSPELGAWYPGTLSGENVACVPGCPTSGQQPFDLWMNSPPHAANVLRPEFTRIGVATQCNGSVMMVVAQYRSD